MVYTEALESKLNEKQRGHSFGLVPTLVLVPIKADPTIKKESYKRDTVSTKGADNMYQSNP